MLGNRNSKQFSVLFAVLAAIAEKSGNRFELAEKMQVSPQVIGRQVKLLRDRFGMTIKSSTKYGYSIEDWGIIDQRRFEAMIETEESQRLGKQDFQSKKS